MENLAEFVDIKVNESIDSKFQEFLDRKGMPYERILLKNYFDRITAILNGSNPPL